MVQPHKAEEAANDKPTPFHFLGVDTAGTVCCGGRESFTNGCISKNQKRHPSYPVVKPRSPRYDHGKKRPRGFQYKGITAGMG